MLSKFPYRLAGYQMNGDVMVVSCRLVRRARPRRQPDPGAVASAGGTHPTANTSSATLIPTRTRGADHSSCNPQSEHRAGDQRERAATCRTLRGVEIDRRDAPRDLTSRASRRAAARRPSAARPPRPGGASAVPQPSLCRRRADNRPPQGISAARTAIAAAPSCHRRSILRHRGHERPVSPSSNSSAVRASMARAYRSRRRASWSRAGAERSP